MIEYFNSYLLNIPCSHTLLQLERNLEVVESNSLIVQIGQKKAGVK